MEIKDPIHGAIEVNASETRVLDSVAFQRLRSIKQLGFAEFAFPGATHNRYIHSLGVMHLSGAAFDSVFRGFEFSSPAARRRLRQATRLGALLHDIGHGPLSHAIEEVMPNVGSLAIDAYRAIPGESAARQATHEDYTIKFLSDSPLTEILRRAFPDLTPLHICCLIDKRLPAPDDFFSRSGTRFAPGLKPNREL